MPTRPTEPRNIPTTQSHFCSTTIAMPPREMPAARIATEMAKIICVCPLVCASEPSAMTSFHLPLFLFLNLEWFLSPRHPGPLPGCTAFHCFQNIYSDLVAFDDGYI